MRKLVSKCIVICIISSLLGGCGQNKYAHSSSQSSADSFLSDSVKIIDTNGRNELDRSSEISSLFEEKMFWGQWVLKESNEEEETPSSGAHGKIDISRGEFKSRVESFPSFLQIGPLRDENDKYEGFEHSLSVDGYNYAELLYKTSETDSTSDVDDEAIVDIMNEGGRWCRAVYSVRDKRLTFGIFDVDPDNDIKADSIIPINKVEYSFEWKGSELTLKKGNESVTYVPHTYKKNGNRILFDGAYTLNNNKDGFIRLSFMNDKSFAEKYYELKDTITVDYSPDGNGLSIIGSDNQEYKYDAFYYSGEILVLLSDDKLHAFACSNYADASQDIKFNFLNDWEFQEDVIYFYSSDSSENIHVYESLFNSSLKGVIDCSLGFSAPGTSISDVVFTDLEAEIPPASVTGVFTIIYDGIAYYVKAVNIYNHTVPLMDCFICSACLDCSSSKEPIIISPELEIGKASFLDIKNRLDLNCQEITDDRIVFSNTLDFYFDDDDDDPFKEIDSDNQVLHSDGICRYIFSLEDGILDSLTFELPGLISNSNDSYQEEEKQRKMDSVSESDNYGSPSASAEEMDIRKGIAEKLNGFFDEAGIDVDINRDTGVITLDSEILFDSGKYNVKDSGKDYLSRFSKVLIQAMFDESVRKNIKGVEIVGHTDTKGSYDMNLSLSEKRANAVKEFVLAAAKDTLTEDENKSLNKFITSQGRSFNDPVYDDNGEIDMDASRRVEITFNIYTP